MSHFFFWKFVTLASLKVPWGSLKISNFVEERDRGGGGRVLNRVELRSNVPARPKKLVQRPTAG